MFIGVRVVNLFIRLFTAHNIRRAYGNEDKKAVNKITCLCITIILFMSGCHTGTNESTQSFQSSSGSQTDSEVTSTGETTNSVNHEDEDFKYNNAKELLNNKQFLDARDAFLEIEEYKDSKNIIQELDEEVYKIAANFVSSGEYIQAGLLFLQIIEHNDSRAQYFKLTNLIPIYASDRHTVGLKKDGTVVATGDNEDGQTNVSDWTDIGVPSE